MRTAWVVEVKASFSGGWQPVRIRRARARAQDALNALVRWAERSGYGSNEYRLREWEPREEGADAIEGS